MSILRDDNKPIDDAGYQHSYGNVLENWYFENYEDNKRFQRTPEEVARTAYQEGRRVEPGESYENWASRHKIDRFTTQTTEKLPEFEKQWSNEQTRAKNLEEMSPITRGLVGGTHKLIGGIGGGVPMLLGKAAELVTGGQDNAVSKWLTKAGHGIYSQQMEQASLYPTLDLFDPNNEGFAVNPELKDPSNWPRFLLESVGDALPSIGMGIASFFTGGAAAAGPMAGKIMGSKLTQGFVKSMAQKAIDKGIVGVAGDLVENGVIKKTAQQLTQEAAEKYALDVVGRRTGAWLGTAIMESSGSFAETVDHMNQKYLAAGVPPEEALLRAQDDASGILAITTGSAAAFVEFAGGNLGLLEKLSGKKTSSAVRELLALAQDARATPEIIGRSLNAIKSLVKEVAKNSGEEFLQESGQEVLNLLNVDFADPDFSMISADGIKQAIAAGVVGGIAGGGMAMGSRGVEAGKNLLSKDKANDPAAEAKSLSRMIENQERYIAANPARAAEVQPLLAENKAKLAELKDYVDVQGQGVSYADAVKLIQEKAPNPTGKPFTAKALRKLIADPSNPLKNVTGASGTEYRGTVDKASLDEFIKIRNPGAQPAATPAAAAAPSASISASVAAPAQAAAAPAAESTPAPVTTKAASPVKASGIAALDEAFPADGIAFDEKSHTYSRPDGRPFEGVTSRIAEASGADTEQIIEQILVRENVPPKLREKEAARLRAEFDEKREGGTAKHAAIEKVLRGERDGADPADIAIVDELTDGGKLPAASERVLYSDELNLAGTADVTVELPDGTFRGADFKTVDELPVEGEKEQGMGYYAGGAESKYIKHSVQLAAYKAIMASKGLKVSDAKIVLVPRDGSGHMSIEPDFSSEEFKTAFAKTYPGRNFDTSPAAREGISDEELVGKDVVDKAHARTSGHRNARSREAVAKELADVVRAIGSKEGFEAEVGEPKITLDKLREYDGRPLREIMKAFPSLVEDEVAAAFHAHGLTISKSTPKARVAKGGLAKHMAAKEIVAAIGGKAKKLLPHIVVYESMDQLEDPALRDWLESEGDVQAFFHDGKIYLDATKIADEKDLTVAILHELFHAAEHPFLMKLVAELGVGAGIEEWNKILDRVWNDFNTEILELHKSRYSSINIKTEVGRRDMAREFLSERGATGPAATFFDRTVAILRKLINRLLVAMGKAPLKMSDAEVRDLLSKMKALVVADLKSGKGLESVESGARARKEDEAKPDAPAVDVVGGRAVVKKVADLPDAPGIEPVNRRQKFGTSGLESGKPMPSKTPSAAEVQAEKAEIEKLDRESEMTKEEVRGERIKEMEARHAVEDRQQKLRDEAWDRIQEEKKVKRAQKFEEDRIYMERIVERRMANFKRVGENWEERYREEGARLFSWLMDLRSRGVKFDEKTFEAEILRREAERLEGLKSVREMEIEKQRDRERKAEAARAAVELRSERMVDTLLPDEELVLDPVLAAPGRKAIPGLTMTQLRESIARHSKVRFAWGDYIKEAIKKEDYNVILSGVLEAFARASEEAAILSTVPVVDGRTVSAIKPNAYDTANRETIQKKEQSADHRVRVDLLNSAIAEMKAVSKELEKLLAKYDKTTHAAQYGNIFSTAVRNFNTSLHALYKMKSGTRAEEALAILYKNIADENRVKIAKQRQEMSNNPAGRDVSMSRLSWFNFPSLVEYFDYVVQRHRMDLDDAKDTLRSNLPSEIKDLIAWSMGMQTVTAFYRGRFRDSHAQALIQATELLMVQPADDFVSGTVSERDAANIGTAFKTLRQTGETEDQLSEEDKSGLAETRILFTLSNDIRSAITNIGHSGEIYGGNGRAGQNNAKNIVLAAPAPTIQITYEKIVSELLNVDMDQPGIFNYKQGEESLLKNYEEAPIEGSTGDNNRIIEAAERLGLPVPSWIVPIFPKIDGVSALDYYLEKFHEGKKDSPELAAMSEDEILVAIIGVGYHSDLAVFNQEFLSEDLVEKLVGIGAATYGKKGDLLQFTKYAPDSIIGKVIGEPLSVSTFHPDNPRPATFVRGALMPKGAYVPEESSYEKNGVLYVDPADDATELERLVDPSPKFGLIRSFRPGAILYHRSIEKPYFKVNDQVAVQYAVVGPKTKESGGKVQYEIIPLHSAVDANKKVHIRTGPSVWMTHEELSAEPIAVVPRVWDVLSGHGERGGVKARSKNLMAMDDYRAYMTMRYNAAKKALRDLGLRTGLFVDHATFGHISKDLNGQRVLTVGGIGGALYSFKVVEKVDPQALTDERAFEEILSALVASAREAGLNRYRRQALDTLQGRDVAYLEDTVSEAAQIAQDVIFSLATRGVVTESQAEMARKHLRLIASIAALNIKDAETGRTTNTADLAAQMERAIADHQGSFDTFEDSFAPTATALMSALKALGKRRIPFVQDILGSAASLDSEGGVSTDDILHMMDQHTEVGEDGDESVSSGANVRSLDEIPREFVDSMVQDYIESLLGIEEWDFSVGYKRMLADVERLNGRYEKAVAAASTLEMTGTKGQLQNAIKLKNQLREELGKAREMLEKRKQSESDQAERARAEKEAAIGNIQQVAQNMVMLLQKNTALIHRQINTGESVRVVAIHAHEHFSDRLMHYMNKMLDSFAGAKPGPETDQAIINYYSGVIIGMLLDGSRVLENIGFSFPQLRLTLAYQLQRLPIPQTDGTYRLFSEASVAQRKAVVAILGKAAFLQALVKRQIQLSDLPINHEFTSFVYKTENVPYTSRTGAETEAKGVPGIVELVTGLTEESAIADFLKKNDPLGIPAARNFNAEAFALRVANGYVHPLFGHLATGDSLQGAMESVRMIEEAAYKPYVRGTKKSSPSAVYYSEEHVMPDHFDELFEEEMAEQFMIRVERAEDETDPFFAYKNAVTKARESIAKSQDGLVSRAGSLSEADRGKVKHGNLGHVKTTVSSMRALEQELSKVGGSVALMHQVMKDIPGISKGALSPDMVDSFISQDGTKYIRMLYHEMFPEESYLGISDVTPTSADMKIVDAVNYIIPGFVKLRDGGISGNPNFRESTKFDSESVIVINDAANTEFGNRVMTILFQILDAIRETPRAFTVEMRSRALQVMMANIRGVYGDAQAKKVTARMQKALGLGTGEAPRFRINTTGKKNPLKVDASAAVRDVQKVAEKWLDELDTVKSGGRPRVVVHGVGETAEKQLRWMGMEERTALSKIYKDATFALKNAFGFRDKNGDIHIFLDQHVGEDGRPDMAEVMRTVAHEYVAHVGLRRTLGSEYDSIMTMIFEKYCNPGQSRSNLSPAEKVHIAEEYFGEKAEDIKWDPALGRANNRHIGNALDRILSLLVKKFRDFAKRAFGKDIKITAFEVRDIMRQAFEGSQMSGRTGFASFLAPGLVAGENLTSYAGFNKYAMNMIDRFQHAVAAKLLPFERLMEAYMSSPNAVPIDRLHLGNDPAGRFFNKMRPFGRKVLFNFMSHFSAYKSRAAEMIEKAMERESAYADSYAGKNYNAEDVSATGLAIYTIQRMLYESSADFRARWEAELQERAAAAGRPELQRALLNKQWARRMGKLHKDRKISGMTLREAILAIGSAIKAGHLTGFAYSDISRLIGVGASEGTEAVRGFLAEYAPGLAVVPTKGDAEDIATAKATVEALELMIRSASDNYAGPMVSTLQHVWDAADEMAAVSGDAGMLSVGDIKEFKKYLPNAVVAPGGGSRAFRGVGGLSYVGGNRFSYEEGSPLAAAQEWPDSPSATFAALRRRMVEAEVNKAVTTLFNFAAYNPLPEVFNLFVQNDIVSEFQRAHPSLAGKNRGAIVTQMLQDGFSLMSDPDMRKRTPSSLARKKDMEAREGLVPVYIRGRLNYIKILHPELAKAFQLHFRPNRVSGALRALSGINRWLISMATLLSPEFWLSNTPRDLGMAIGVLAMQGNIGGKDGLQFAKDSAKLIPHAMRYLFAKNFKKDTSGIRNSDVFDKYYEDFKYGGEIQWAFMETSIETMKTLESKIRLAKGQGNKKDHFVQAKNGFVGFMRNISGAFENTTRFVVFCAAREAGMANDQAVMMARNVTVDFDKKGAYGELFNTLYMFANAGIQANLNFAKLVRNNPGRAAKAVGGMVALSFGLAMMNFAIGGDGEDGEAWYGTIPQETRNNHIVIMLPFTDGVPLKIPFPYVFSFFWGMGQELGSMVFGRSTAAEAGAGIMASLMKNFNPMETASGLQDVHGWVRMLSPTVTDPLVDIISEKTPFGTPLMPEATFDGQPDSRRHWRSVSSINRELARTMNDWTFGSAGESGLVDISPETLDYMYEMVTGGLGKFLARVGGVVLSPMTGKEIGVNDIPGIRRFVGGQQKWESRGRFSENYKQVLGAHATMRELNDAATMAQVPSVRDRARQDAEDFRSENKHILAMRRRANETLSQVKKIDKQKERLYKSGLPDREIQQRLRQLDERQAEIFSGFNRIYYQTVDLN